MPNSEGFVMHNRYQFSEPIQNCFRINFGINSIMVRIDKSGCGLWVWYGAWCLCEYVCVCVCAWVLSGAYCQKIECHPIHTAIWQYYMSWAHSITMTCTCVNNTSCNQTKVVPEPEIQAPQRQRRTAWSG